METMSSNATLAAALRQMAESGRIPHAMLFHQNDGGDAFQNDHDGYSPP